MWLSLGEFVCKETNCRWAGLQSEICWLMSFMWTSTFWKPRSAQMFLEMVHSRETDFWQRNKEILKGIIVPEVWEFMASLCTGNLNVNWYLYQFPFWGSLSLLLTFLYLLCSFSDFRFMMKYLECEVPNYLIMEESLKEQKQWTYQTNH